jgi:hypothetical protein
MQTSSHEPIFSKVQCAAQSSDGDELLLIKDAIALGRSKISLLHVRIKKHGVAGSLGVIRNYTKLALLHVSLAMVAN